MKTGSKSLASKRRQERPNEAHCFVVIVSVARMAAATRRNGRRRRCCQFINHRHGKLHNNNNNNKEHGAAMRAAGAVSKSVARSRVGHTLHTNGAGGAHPLGAFKAFRKKFSTSQTDENFRRFQLCVCERNLHAALPCSQFEIFVHHHNKTQRNTPQLFKESEGGTNAA